MTNSLTLKHLILLITRGLRSIHIMFVDHRPCSDIGGGRSDDNLCIGTT